MTSVSGAVVWSATYSSFGKASVDVGNVTNNLRFAGQYEDVETGLHYNWFRYFSVEVGRYTRPDPIGFWGGKNLFLYASNNPLIYIDHTGLKVYRCQRPLKPGKPGDKIPFHKKVLKLYHEYNCITLPDGSMKCDSTSPGPNWPLVMEPGVPSNPKDDYYHENTCELIDDDTDFCVEECLNKKWSGERPNYDIGPGTDCQEYSSTTFSDCVTSCQKRDAN